MRLPILRTFMGRPASNDRDAWPRALKAPCLLTIAIVIAWLVWPAAMAPPPAQQANQPGFDPRQSEKYFDDQQNRTARPAERPSLRMPQFERPQADTKPQFALRGVTITGALAIPRERLAGVYQPYLGRTVSQADLVAIAEGISDLYRAAGFHLSRAVIPPQDIQNGRVLVRVIEGGITEVALMGDDAERFGVRPFLNPVLAEFPSRLSTLERQLLLVNGLPGLRVAVYLKSWHVYTWFGLDNLGSSAIGPWQSYATGAFNSYLLPGDSLVLNLSTTPNNARELGFGRVSYDVPVGTDGIRVGASALYSAVRPGDDRRLINDRTITEAFDLRTSVTPLQSQGSSLTVTAALDY